MKRKRQQSKQANQLSLLDYKDRLTQIVQETNLDPDYERFKAVFAQLSKDLETSTNAEGHTQSNF